MAPRSNPPTDKPTSDWTEQEQLAFSQLARVIASALVDHRLETFASQLKDANSTGTDQKITFKAQAALRDAISPILTGLLTPSSDRMDEFDRNSKTMLSDLGRLTSMVGDLKELLSNERLEDFLHPSHKFLQTLAEDRKEKEFLAKRLCEQYFQQKELRCFVQGSSLAYLLGQEIANSGAAGTLIHTNSTVMHLSVLRERCKQFVYTFCGSVYDPICAAWLFPSMDTSTAGRLTELFTRTYEPLEIAFVMPYRFSASRLYFRKEETATLVETLAQCARTLVVCVVADRYLSPTEEDKAGTDHLSAIDFPASHKSKLAVVGCPSANRLKQDLMSKFEAKGVDVDWVESKAPQSEP